MKNLLRFLIFVVILIILIGIPVYKKETNTGCTGEYWENFIEWNLCNSLLKENCPFSLISRNIAYSNIGNCLCDSFSAQPAENIGAEILKTCDQAASCGQANMIREIKDNTPSDFNAEFVCKNKELLFPGK